MIVRYRSFPNRRGGLIYRPLIMVKIKYKTMSFYTWGLLDSGADRTSFNKEIGKNLGIDFNSCTMSTAQGISGNEQEAWDTQVEIEVAGFEKNIFKADVSFIESKAIGVILGHTGFFEFFDVKLQTAKRQFEIELARG